MSRSTGAERTKGAGRRGFDALFSLKRPCGNCPFLKVGAIDLAPGRLEGIVRQLLDNDWTTFSCHKHVHHPSTGGEWGEEGDYSPSGREGHCMGAMAFLQKVGRPNVPMRLGYLNGKLQLADVEACMADVIDDVATQAVAQAGGTRPKRSASGRRV